MRGKQKESTTKKLFRGLRRARYNVASWKTKSGHTFIIFRQIKKRGLEGEPDFTKLVLVELNESMDPIHERVVWEPKNESLLLEDPRALALSDGSVVIGLTALLRGNEGKYIPYPAVTKLQTNEWRESLPAVTVIETFGPGKNTTPVEPDVFFFRPEGKRYSHRLMVFSLKNYIPKKEQVLKFPKRLSWARYRIGTAMPPLWFDDRKSLMIFHGITQRDGIFMYSLGRAGLTKEDGKYHVKVKRKPIMDPSFFLDKKGRPLAKELHPELRKVVYSCGGILRNTNDKETLVLFVNVGDTSTFQVEIPLTELTKNLF